MVWFYIPWLNESLQAVDCLGYMISCYHYLYQQLPVTPSMARKNIHLSDLSWSQQIWGKITNFTAFFKHCGLKRILPKHERASHVIRSRIGGMLQSASYVHTKTTPRNVGGIKRLEYFYSEHHILRGDLCKSGPRYFASEKKFSLKLCPINYLW